MEAHIIEGALSPLSWIARLEMSEFPGLEFIKSKLPTDAELSKEIEWLRL